MIKTDKKKLLIIILLTLAFSMVLIAYADGVGSCPKCNSEVTTVLEIVRHQPCNCYHGELHKSFCDGLSGGLPTGCKWEAEYFFDTDDKHKSFTVSYSPCVMCEDTQGIMYLGYQCGLTELIFHECEPRPKPVDYGSDYE